MDMNFNPNNQSSKIDLDNYNSKPFQLFETMNVNNEDKFKNLNGTMMETTLSKLYFSQENLDYVQSQIISRIYEKTNKNHIIGRQSDDELLIVMRSIYLQHGKNSEVNIQNQINSLNELVLDYCIDNVYSNLIAHFEYIKDITQDQPILDRPQTTNVKGSKGLQPNYFL